ncbi:MAG: OmpH family outer membrane protein [Pirellulales bacterium]
MRTILTSSVLAAALLAALALGISQAQQPTQPPAQRSATPVTSTGGVAVIDINYILDNYQRLKQEADRFKADVEATGKQFKLEQDAIVKSAEKLKSFKPGSPEYKSLEEELTKKQSDLKVSASLKEKEFAEKESQMYLAAYRQVTNLVKVYSERNGINLVLRFNGKPADPNNRDAIRAELFKTVLYNSISIDITDPILAELNRGAVPPTATRPAAPGQAPVRTR